MTYYPMPDIPADVTPDQRRFCEQVRSVVSRLEKYGQSFEVHQPFYATPEFAASLVLDEFPVYRADVPIELLYAMWTVPFSESVKHDIGLYWRAGDGGTSSELVQIIQASSGATTDWVAQRPKRFESVQRTKQLLPGHILTLSITEQTGGGIEPWGLLSMYFRRAEAS